MPPNNSPSITPGASVAATPYFDELAELTSPVPDYAATLRTQEEDDANDANVSFLRSQPGVQGESSPRATSSPLAITAIAEVVPGPNTEDVGRIRRGLGSREIRHRYTPAQLQELGTLHESTLLGQGPDSRGWVPESSDDDDDWGLPVVLNPYTQRPLGASRSVRYSYRSIRQDLSLLPPTSPSISESSTRAMSLPEDLEASEPATASDSSLRTTPLSRSLRPHSQFSSLSSLRLPHYLLEGDSPGHTSDGPGRPGMVTSTQPISSNSTPSQQRPSRLPPLPSYVQPHTLHQSTHAQLDSQLQLLYEERAQRRQEEAAETHQYAQQHTQQQPPHYQHAQPQLQPHIQRQVQRQQRRLQELEQLRQLQAWHEQRQQREQQQQQQRPPPPESQLQQQLSPAEQLTQRQPWRQEQLQALQQAQALSRLHSLQAQRQANQPPQAQRQTSYISANSLQAQQAAQRRQMIALHREWVDQGRHQQLNRLETYRQRYLENPAPNPPSSSRSLDEAIKYLGRLCYCESEHDRFLSAKAGGFRQEEYMANTDFILDTSIIGPPPQSSWLMIGAVFSGSQHAASSSAPAGYRGYPNSVTQTSSHVPQIFHNAVRPLVDPDASRAARPNQVSDLSSGDIPHRRSDGDERWPVKVTIHSIDYDSMTLSGTMEAFNVPDKTSPTRESSISTFLEGEILDFNKYTLETKSFKANAHVDGTYWRELAPFRDLPEEELVKSLVSKKWLTEELSKKWILMRWKEKCFVTPTDAQSSLTISGFYYVSLRREDGHVEGLYYDPSSTPYQHLSLMPKKRYFPAYTFQ